MPHALVVDDETASLASLQSILEGDGFTVAIAASVHEGRAVLRERRPDLVLVNLVLPDGRGLEILDVLGSREGIEVVAITTRASIDSVIEALQLGSSDCLSKPIDAARLEEVLERVQRVRAAGRRDDPAYKRQWALGRFGPLIGRSAPMRGLCRLISKVAPTDATVFIHGESGSGKEVVAQAVHELSPRAESPFVAVNCAAISPTLIESQIFGHEKGSFTGATEQHRGEFERANGGTLFLDEIGEMPIELQAKFLRVLETGSFLRVGGSEPIAVDVRVIAATNRRPEEAIAESKLREDLYYRLNVFSLAPPPLRERHADIELLAAHFLAEFNRSSGASKSLDEETLARLQAYRWPGNVRELRNVLCRAFIIAGDRITPACLAPEIEGARSAAPDPQITIRLGTPLVEIERQVILATLAQNAGNRKLTSKILGINPRTLFNRLKAYGENGNGASGRNGNGSPAGEASGKLISG